MDAQMEKKLQEVIDERDIRALMQRYSRGLDRLDKELVESIYWPDAVDDHGQYVGHPSDFIDWADSTTVMWKTTSHAVANHYIELAGDDAYGEAYYIFTSVANEPGAPGMMSTGRYVDHYQRRNGEWRIANRVAVIESTYKLEPLMKERISSYAPGEDPTSRDRNDVSYQRPLRTRPPTGLVKF